MIRTPKQPGEGASPARRSSARLALVDRLLELQPELRRRFAAGVPSHFHELRASLQEMLANTTVRQLEVLRLLATHGRLAMHELAELTDISRSSATELVDRLETHGLAERRHDPQNRRSVEVALTVRAQESLAQFRELQRAGLAALADVYSNAELAALVGLLEKLAVSKLPGSAGSEPQPEAARAELGSRR
ncbi:MAG TPA: MarR family transcriptional regulator [Candidatus Dormibacteraeota bacterium]|nr:MarR family transcriptional regulator [Candidatus Dormibacteraeota bacterium]